MSAQRSRVLSCTAAAVCFAGAFAPCPASAQKAGKAVVVVMPKVSDPITERALDAVEAGLADLPVRLATERIEGWDSAIANRVDSAREISSRSGAIAVVWLDLSAPQHVFLFISDPTGGRILVRDVLSENQDVEAQLETLSLIVRSSVKGLLSGGEIGVAAPSADAADGARGERFGVSLGYALQLYAPTDPVIHGARIELNAGLSRWMYLFAAYRLNLPVTSSPRELEVDIWTHPIELGLFGRARFPRWELDVGAACVVDVVTFDVTSRVLGIAAVEPEREATVGIEPLVRVSRALRSVVALYFSMGIDVELLNNRFVVDTGGGEKAVISPWRLRPMFELGARFTVL